MTDIGKIKGLITLILLLMSTYASSAIHLSCEHTLYNNQNTYLITLDKANMIANLSIANLNYIRYMVGGWEDIETSFTERIYPFRGETYDVYEINVKGKSFLLDRATLILHKHTLTPQKILERENYKFQCKILDKKQLEKKYDMLVQEIKRNKERIKKETQRKI
ncbi:MAG: hypothetical protein CBC24_03955 [Candidatus Pelagibacter sp. TMED64]|nr:MAG: hypothetical protein CBC24_03955 [Candidatus Pelagibacter sp. TMED64]